MRIIIITVASLLLFSCFGPKVSVGSNKIIKKTTTQEENKESNKIKDEIKTDEFVYLFFDKSNFQSKPAALKTVKKEVAELNPNDYKVIVDWLIEDGTRQIKLKNLKTGQVYIIKENDKSGEIILLERNLFDYKFRIGDQTVKVKR